MRHKQKGFFLCDKFIAFCVLVIFYTSCSADKSSSSPSLGQSAVEFDESEKAYNDLSILHASETSSTSPDHSQDSQIVIKGGVVSEQWRVSAAETKSGHPSDLVYRDDQYTDRISFEFSYGRYEAYDIAIPTCFSSDSSVARPKVIEFQNEPEDLSGAFTVVYDCQRNAASSLLRNASVSLVFPVVSGMSATFSFWKMCGGGRHEYLELGYYEESGNAAKEVSRSRFSNPSPPLMVGPHVMSTKVYLHLRPPATTQEFFHVSVKSSNQASLEVTPKGPLFGGVLNMDESSIIHIFYECHSRGRYEVQLSLPVHPFESLNASWVKDCGGGLARGLNIGSTLSQGSDVVRRGLTAPSWNVGVQSSSEGLSPMAPLVNTSFRSKEFWLFNEGFPLHVDPPVITVEKPSVVTALAPKSYTSNSIYSTESTGILSRGERVRCRIGMICKKKGKSIVVVTFPIKSFTNLEIGFVKECRAPRRYVKSSFLRTSSSVMTMIWLFVTIILAYYWKIKKHAGLSAPFHKPAPGYQPV